MARKPLAKGHTVAANVLEHGTGAINVDACRIAGEPWKAHDATGLASVKFFTNGEAPVIHKEPHTAGRWPPNVVLSCCGNDPHDSDCAAAILDAQSGERGPGARPNRVIGSETRKGAVGFAGDRLGATYPDTGGASRFFYTAKASRAERNRGLEGMEEQLRGTLNGYVNPSEGRTAPKATGGPQSNFHPTVKPIALMRWLVRMVTPPGGIVLDPFCGSGSTGVAAIQEGFDVIGIDLDPDYLEIAERRIAHAQQQGRQVAFESA